MDEFEPRVCQACGTILRWGLIDNWFGVTEGWKWQKPSECPHYRLTPLSLVVKEIDAIEARWRNSDEP